MSIGGEVLLKQRLVNQSKATFDPPPYRLVEKNEIQVVIQSPDMTFAVDWALQNNHLSIKRDGRR